MSRPSQPAPSLTTLQESAITDLLAVRRNDPRAAGYGLTLLNRDPRGIHRVRKDYECRAAKLGFRPEQIAEHWQDIKEMAKLQEEAD